MINVKQVFILYFFPEKARTFVGQSDNQIQTSIWITCLST